MLWTVVHCCPNEPVYPKARPYGIWCDVQKITSGTFSPCTASPVSRNPFALSIRQSSPNTCKPLTKNNNVEFNLWSDAEFLQVFLGHDRKAFCYGPKNNICVFSGNNLRVAWKLSRAGKGLHKFFHPKGWLKRERLTRESHKFIDLGCHYHGKEIDKILHVAYMKNSAKHSKQ